VQSVNTAHRLAAISLALSITFGIVLALSDYAYAAPSPMVGKAVPANPCQ
jgi:hypothetical protein